MQSSGAVRWWARGRSWDRARACRRASRSVDCRRRPRLPAPDRRRAVAGGGGGGGRAGGGGGWRAEAAGVPLAAGGVAVCGPSGGAGALAASFGADARDGLDASAALVL